MFLKCYVMSIDVTLLLDLGHFFPPEEKGAGYKPAVWEPGEVPVGGGCHSSAHGLSDPCLSLLSPPCLAPQAQSKWNLVSPETSPCDMYACLKDSYYPSIYIL